MNKMMYQPYYGNQGMVPNQQQVAPKTGNWLSAEKRAILQKGISQFKLSVTDEEMAKGQCNHYDQNGVSALIPDADGSGGYTCSICGTHFVSRNYTPEEVKSIVDETLNVLNTIKIMYLSLDPNAALEYFQIYPFIEKIPQLYNIALQDFKKYEGVGDFVPSNNMNPFNMFAAMSNPGFGYGMNMMQPQYGYQQQPMGMGYGQPQMMPQGNMNTGYAQANPTFNPIYGQPQMAPGMAPQQPVNAYQPQTQGYSMNAMGAAAPAQQPYINPNMPNAMNPTGAAPTQAAPAPAVDTTTPAATK
jgi:hypothetical protein